MKALEAIQLLNRPDIGIDVVVGESNPNKDKIKDICSAMPDVRYHCQIDNMAQLMVRADLAVGAGGIATWERCCLGLPCLVSTLAINQEATIETMADECCLLYFGKSEKTTSIMISKYIDVAIDNPYLLNSFSKKNLLLVDGRGYERVIKYLMSASIELRLATKTDSKDIYLWRNAEETRKFSFTATSISWEEHTKWFEATLSDPNKILLIGEVDGEPIGVIRFDIDIDNESAKISVYLVPGKYGQGYGPKLIENGNRWLLQEYPNIKTVRAEILKANIASMKAFIEAGFEEHTNILRFVTEVL
ncbi:MAG: GNAT family N-acetyltransferase [Candidatus Desantisbacteria bacterium]